MPGLLVYKSMSGELKFNYHYILMQCSIHLRSSAVPTSQRRIVPRRLALQRSTITKAICCPKEPMEERPQSTCLAAAMARAVANVTINHHEGHLLSWPANGGAHIDNGTIVANTTINHEPTEDHAAAMATVVANTTINHHKGHLLSRQVNGGLNNQEDVTIRRT
jgi:hypothetical protein